MRAKWSSAFGFLGMVDWQAVHLQPPPFLFVGSGSQSVPCFRPLIAYPAPPGAADKRPVFTAHRSYAGARGFKLPCGVCRGCREARAREWAVRLAHENSLHERSCFITPTYSDEHLPPDGAVTVRAVQLLLKRVRNHFGCRRVRYFACGEYGGRFNRPHYHVMLFGVDFDDKVPWRTTGSGAMLYRSEILQGIWTFGDCLIGDVTPASCGYVARYTVKKVEADDDDERLTRWRFDPETGEVKSWLVRSEFITMSTRPGIGAGWYEQFSGDAFPSDFVIVDGQKRPVPRFYRKLLDAEEAGCLLRGPRGLRIDWKRKVAGRAPAVVANNTDARLVVREEVARLRHERLTRELEDGS